MEATEDVAAEAEMEAEKEDEGNRGCTGGYGRRKLCYRARLYLVCGSQPANK